MTQSKTTMTAIKVNNIHLVRTKKLKGGRFAVRSLRVIPLHCIKTTVSGNQHRLKMVVDFDHRYGVGQMIGVVNKEKGEVNFDAKAFIPEGYLKGRGFELMGYSVEANLTNTGKRRKS